MNLLELYEEYLEASIDKRLVLFGASLNAIKNKQKYLINEDIYYISDNDSTKWGSTFLGAKIISPEELTKFKDEIVIIVTSVYYKEIKNQLNSMGFKLVYPYHILSYKVMHSIYHFRDQYKLITPDVFEWQYVAGNNYKKNIKLIEKNKAKIEKVRNFLSDERSKYIFDMYIKKMKYNYVDYRDLYELDKQYFVDGMFEYSDNEVFVDAGCFDGSTSIDFAKETNFEFKKVYAFEPDKQSYIRSLNCFNKYSYFENKYELINAGLSDKNETVNFNNWGDIRSSISVSGGTEVEVKRLDDVINEKVTFIKMDIEGAEIDALKGSKNIIEKYSPKLAISVYHKFDDLWEIPLLINDINPNYKFFLRHHAFGESEKVLYAKI